MHIAVELDLISYIVILFEVPDSRTRKDRDRDRVRVRVGMVPFTAGGGVVEVAETSVAEVVGGEERDGVGEAKALIIRHT